jgi:hypothetical protein
VSWEQFKKAVETLVLLDKLGVVFGVGGMSALVFGLWAQMSDLPVVHVVLTALAAFAVSVVAINGWRAYRKSQRPNYTKWDMVNEFTLTQAAELWEEQDPIGLGRPNQESYPRLRMMKEKARSAELAVNDPTAGAKAIATRSALIAFAQKLGQRPKFLYPDER